MDERAERGDVPALQVGRAGDLAEAAGVIEREQVALIPRHGGAGVADAEIVWLDGAQGFERFHAKRNDDARGGVVDEAGEPGATVVALARTDWVGRRPAGTRWRWRIGRRRPGPV